MIPLLALSGCALFTGNGMSARGDAPFTLGTVTSSLWLEDDGSDPRDGYGRAYLFLGTERVSCDDFTDEVNGERSESESLLWTGAGLVLSYAWQASSGENAGWEGSYYQGMVASGYDDTQDAAQRIFSSVAFSRGSAYHTDYAGHGVSVITDFSDDAVVGTAETDLYTAQFRTEICPKVERAPSEDTAWFETMDE